MKITKAILTGGGRATRLQPVTATINKHLLPLANKPMIVHAVEKVVEAGVTDIFINTNPGDTSLEAFLGDGSRFGARITYFEQTGGPQGIAHVVNEAERFIGDDPFLFYLSDNILLGSLQPLIQEFDEQGYDCMLALSEVPDPERFGVPIFDEKGNLVKVVEKPEHPPNHFAVTGVYLYGPKLFFDAFKRIHKSSRGEYEISDIHSLLLHDGKKVGYKEITGWWKDTGKPEDLLLANKLLLDGMNRSDFPNHGSVDASATVEGSVHVGAGSTVGKGVTIHGPAMIGNDCLLEDCTIGPHVTLGNGTQVNRATIKNTIVLDGGRISGPCLLEDSLLGKKVTIRINGHETRTYRVILGDKTVVDVQ
ncbi:MAG TPA: glucose-1-phosphate thymidylyltransferase [Candidatus Kapabacteria bacterium]|nr:glucose-1-phosphate thymidylyltransferase [Candidatus Kapabacteria bacterium]